MTPRTASAPWLDFDLVQRAQRHAAEAHREVLRKGTTIPYLSHLWSVASLVLEHGGDDEQVAAALLHDVVEDTGGLPELERIRAACSTTPAASSPTSGSTAATCGRASASPIRTRTSGTTASWSASSCHRRSPRPSPPSLP